MVTVVSWGEEGKKEQKSGVKGSVGVLLCCFLLEPDGRGVCGEGQEVQRVASRTGDKRTLTREKGM